MDPVPMTAEMEAYKASLTDMEKQTLEILRKSPLSTILFLDNSRGFKEYQKAMNKAGAGVPQK